MASEHLLNQLIVHEGMESKAYQCSEGYWTIGVGRNIQTLGITKEEAMYLLANDLERVESELDENIPWWRNLSEARQNVLLDMCFNLGISRFLQFKNFLAATEDGRWEDSYREMLDSRWAEQVGARAQRLAKAMHDDILVEV
mgnify:FL=1